MTLPASLRAELVKNGTALDTIPSMLELVPQKGRVFLAIPLGAAHSEPVHSVLRQICLARGLDLHPGNFAGEELHDRLVKELKLAEIVIADLTDCRPNVIYELGYARALRKRVLLVSEKKQEPPTDLAGVICSRFEFDQGRKALINGGNFWREMERAIDDALRSEAPIVLSNVTERTTTIVADLRRLEAALPEGDPDLAEIAFSGFLSPLAISDQDSDGGGEFLHEKRAIQGLIERGCLFRAIICPVNDLANPPLGATVSLARARTRTLLAYLEKGADEDQLLEVAVSTVMQKNLYVIGNVSCIEGFRTGPGEFVLSLRQTGVDVVSASRQLFNLMFDELARTPISSMPLRSPERLKTRQRLRAATIQSLKDSLKCIDRLPP